MYFCLYLVKILHYFISFFLQYFLLRNTLADLCLPEEHQLHHAHPAPPLPFLESLFNIFCSKRGLLDGFFQGLLQFFYINSSAFHHLLFHASVKNLERVKIHRSNNFASLLKFITTAIKSVYKVMCVILILRTVCSVATPCTQIYTAWEFVLAPFSAAVTLSDNWVYQ